LKKEAKEHEYTIFNEIYGELCLSEEIAIKQSSGSVYGILVESDTPPKLGLKPIEFNSNMYPVYWGIAPISRLKAHVQSHQTTGNANLRSIEEIAGKRLIFGAILVSRYSDFEKHMHDKYPPLIGSNKKGRISKIIEVIN